jgi:hypothetical protein
MNQILFLFAAITFLFGCTGHTNSNSNAGLKIAGEAFGQPEESCKMWNKVEYASFKYTRSDSFKTGKIAKPQLLFSADTLVHYNAKKYQVNLKYFDVSKMIFGVGSLSTGNTTVLLFTKEKQFQYFEVKGGGSFEFIGTKEDQNYFRLALNDCNIYFSLSSNRPDVLITEYTVQSE